MPGRFFHTPPTPPVHSVRLAAALLAVLLFSSILVVSGCERQTAHTAVARNGVLDLSDWDAIRDGPIALNGQWEFYWERLLPPEDFQPGASAPERTGFLSFPGFWRYFSFDGQNLPNWGRATFRLRILPGPGGRQLAIKLFSIPAAFRLWANGRFIAGAGTMGNSPTEEIPARNVTIGKITSTGKPLDLVLQITNHTFRQGGVHYPILLATPKQLQKMQLNLWCWAMVFIGGLLSMAIYHFALFYLRKKDASALYVSLYCLNLLVMYVTLDSSEYLCYLFFPHADSMVVNSIGLASYAVSHSVLYRFYRSLFPEVFIVQIQYLCDMKSLAMLVLALFFPYHILYSFFPVLALWSLLTVACIIVQLIICVRRQYECSRILLSGCICLAATAFGEIYNHLFGSTPYSVFPLAASAFILTQAFALAQRFSNAFTSVETLSRTMDASNIALRAEMDERNRLEKEIIRVSEEERRRISHDLHDGLCQSLGGIRLRCGVLEMSPLENRDLAAKIEEISSLLGESVGQAYDLSRGLWPVEHADLGSGPNLKELAQRMSQASGVNIEYIENLACESCGNEHLVQLYRIAQEAVTNAVKHANANRIVISMECRADKVLRLMVRDDGTGRATAASSQNGGLGMRIMRYRARVIGGDFSIADAEPRGTVISCSLQCREENTSE